jgi:hypothetical protein
MIWRSNSFPCLKKPLLPLDTFGNGNRTHRQIILGSEDKLSVIAQAGMDWQKVHAYTCGINWEWTDRIGVS